jgi:hypothetical protein
MQASWKLGLAVSSILLVLSLLGCNSSGDGGLRVRFDPAQAGVVFSEATCDADVTLPLQVTGAASPDSLLFVISHDVDADGSIDALLAPNDVLTGTEPDFTIGAVFPPGEHAVEVTVTDGEGQMDSDAVVFSVADDVPPTPICINGLAIELMPVAPNTDADGDGDFDAGAETIDATDFIASPVSDCSEPITYSIHREGEGADISQTSLVLTCDDPSITAVEVVAWDAAGNGDFCASFVQVQDNMASCAQ